MAAFNQTLWGDLDGAGIFKMVPKTMYPPTIPQQPADFRTPAPAAPAPVRGRRTSSRHRRQPAAACGCRTGPARPHRPTTCAIGYTAAQNSLFVLPRLADRRQRAERRPSGQVLGKTYIESLDEAGARKAAHEFAADILATFGSQVALRHPHLFRAPHGKSAAPVTRKSG